MSTPLADVVAVATQVTETSSRTSKTTAIAALLGRVAPGDLGVVVGLLVGAPRQRRTGIGYRGVGNLPAATLDSSLTVSEVDAAFDELEAVNGSGSQQRRRAVLNTLMARATEPEQSFLVRVLLGELRQGALEAAAVAAIAKASGVPLAVTRRAVMLRGDVAAIAMLAMAEGETAVVAVGLEIGRAVQPMLASSAKTVAEALESTGEAAVDWKLDGVRAQIHRHGDDVHVFTRTLDDVTARVPEVVDAVLALPSDDLVLDAELIALAQDGRPRPFQQTASRFATRDASGPPLATLVFDVLHLDGVDLLDRPGRERWAALDLLLPPEMRIPRTITAEPVAAQGVLEDALAHGHEGVVVKGADAPYEAGRRGAAWVKVKPVHTIDLVVLAAEWGSGRRKGWLSNLHLGARADDGDGFVMLGKTFKGLTDAMLTWQTETLTALAEGPNDPVDGWVVPVRPELVVEIALDGLQASTRYPGGVALRFARVVRHRPDKPAREAATLAEVKALQTQPATHDLLHDFRRTSVDRLDA